MASGNSPRAPTRGLSFLSPDADVRGLHERDDGRIVASLAYRHADGEVEAIAYDHVICCAGFGMDDLPFDEVCRPSTVIDGRFPALTAEFESIDVPNMFFAGTLTQSLDYKRTNSAFVHGFRYNAQALAWILGDKLYGPPLPFRRIARDTDALCDHLLGRINRSSAMWQQFGFIGDVAVAEDDGFRFYEDLPVRYIQQSEVGRSDLHAVLTLEFGEHRDDVFAVKRTPDVDSASKSFFLHPVVRVYARGVLVRTLHLLENLFGEWEHDDLHRRPLRDFLAATLEQPRPRKTPVRALANLGSR